MNYTIEEQEEVSLILQKVNNQILYSFIKDYGELRDKIRICRGMEIREE